MPSLFVSHGAPTLAIEETPAHRFLVDCGRKLGKPKAVLMLSAHFEASVATVTTGVRPVTIHDFGGFPKALFDITYPAPGDPALAEGITELLRIGDIPVQSDSTRGFDHGAWVPLMLMFPDADVPVVQLSIDSRRDPAYHYHLGELLRSLLDQGVLLIGSGGATHNVGLLSKAGRDDPAPDWVKAFGEWLAEAVVNDRRDDLIHYRTRAPHAVRNHPSEEHFLPLLCALGATDSGGPNRRIHASHSYGLLAMDAYLFGDTKNSGAHTAIGSVNSA